MIDEREVLHVVVGHGLPVLFVNADSSFRAVCPEGELLVIDNGSPQEHLRRELAQRAAEDEHMTTVLRDDNHLENAKVGALYVAYRLAFSIAAERGFRYVHLLQGDMQTLWWDGDALDKIAELYRRHPNCVNVYTVALSTDRTLMGNLAVDDQSGDTIIPRYGTTDAGVFDLERWHAAGMTFARSEERTADTALDKGLVTVVSPWPTEVQVPWPAVVRRGRQVGREVRTAKPFLCRPLDADAVAEIKRSRSPVSLETLCVPWGWSCLSPMSPTDLSDWGYFRYRWHALRRYGWKAGRPRWVTAGLDRRTDVLLAPHRPPLVAFFIRPLPSLALEVVQRLIPARTAG